MNRNYSRKVAPFMEGQIALANIARERGDVYEEFKHLENIHVVGQESTYWHVKAHVLMLFWALRNREIREVLGQLFRIIGASTKTAVGLVPRGNTGGANVSPFKTMPINSTLETIITSAKSEK